ncbi:hypothetical protein KDH_11140 [Dictyobacter sp. S3.2.2.5]|uniref:Uncharacterized protein n=1 Tax=Dictyobacter halimunensis TaxID=3026934 RepID=A0ABQ6FKS9_9CHLR|nr:hypothetical protein KDH_11140 [Dictyobacter sp. S3.2.2.5]
MSSTMGLTPRSTLRHRPIDRSLTDIPPWVRASQGLHQHKRQQQFPGQTVLLRFLARFPFASLTTLIGMGMAIILIFVGQWIVSWGTVVTNDWQYGQPRTYQTDAFVGHEYTGQPGHFVVFNIHGQVEVLELPANAVTHARLILGPRLSGPQADLVPVTIQFVPSFNPHAPNMRLNMGTTSMFFLNRHGQFQAPI